MGVTTNWALPYPEAGDPANVPQDIQDLAVAIDDIIASADQGTLAGRPVSTSGSPGKAGRLYYATDNGVLYYDMGTGWVTIRSGVNDAVGIRGYAQKTADQTIVGEAVYADISGLSIAGIVVPAGRRLRITVQATVKNDTPGNAPGFDGIIKRGTTTLPGYWGHCEGPMVSSQTREDVWEGSIIDTPAAGTYTYKAGLLTYYDGYTIVAGGTNQVAWIMVEDIGPAVLL